MSKICENFALQLGYAFGLLAIMGLVIWLLDRCLIKLLGVKNARRLFMTTGAVGVPIHETGHLIFCILFFHKIQGVSLYKFNTQDGTLGYVRHSFNRKNFFQQIGNFFIGVGPMFLGGAIIIGLMYLLIPAVAVEVIGHGIWETVLAIFSPTNFVNGWWWLFIVISTSIAIHMCLSWADIKGCLRGLCFIVPMLFIANVVLYLFSPARTADFTQWLAWFSTLIISFLAIGVLILAALVFIGALIKLATRKRRLTAFIIDKSTALGFKRQEAKNKKASKKAAEDEEKKLEKEKKKEEKKNKKASKKIIEDF